ncbi:MAG: hypothetical protein AUJ52_14230 [Elusimicrobia bacterium CG1_02_63_36]|nr:MAG: hypothetical protein AUJ52_14230 [Elusimicrobia bacterium CG1_02_63_36]PIP84757.1 MAG: hypothetical protein COR54_02445 [Elusimicrobia bacterium CG22_combo_CG10-13_8_21_14_all_63_91]PJA17809.1 MAG: hypothetical protein COX66_03205 [Elusimicrobia bacterium CG_4_10_14_0_2_um_filter_63_34]PJB24647.1 MAG: hypothetical protein CO113_12795 [Elusimicrobia bacterium CG_4_9_14_3_um_filter_62_55]
MRRFLIAFAIAFLAGRALASFPLEEQRVASVMQARLQDSLDRVFGPGRSAANVVVTLATDPRVARRIDEALGAAALGPSGQFEWTWRSGGESKPHRFILPGLPDARDLPPAASGLSIEAAAELAKRASRVSVTVILDDSLPPSADGQATELVARSVDLDRTRGDLLQISRTPFPKPAPPPPSGPVSGAFLWSCLAAFVALFAATLLFLERRLFRGPRPPAAAPLPAPRPAPPVAPPPPLPGDVLSRVRAPFQIDATDASKLFFLLRKESSEDIALVLPHLLPQTRRALLAYFSEDEAARAIEASTRFRVVDPELIVLLKAELERRVAALHGGPEVAAGLLDDAAPEDRTRILSALERFEPELAATIRSEPVAPGEVSGGGSAPPAAPQLFIDEDPP